MGNVFRRKPRRKDVNVLMIDLGSSGSRSVLSQHGRSSGTILSLGFTFNRTKFQHGGLPLNVLHTDLGARQDLELDLDRVKRCLYHIYKDVDSLAFIINSSDNNSMLRAKSVIGIVLAEPRIAMVPVVVFDNRVGSSIASSEKLAVCLGLPQASSQRWFITGSEAETGRALVRGFDWMMSRLSGIQQDNYAILTED